MHLLRMYAYLRGRFPYIYYHYFPHDLLYKKNKQNPFEYFCASRYAYIAAKIPL